MCTPRAEFAEADTANSTSHTRTCTQPRQPRTWYFCRSVSFFTIVAVEREQDQHSRFGAVAPSVTLSYQFNCRPFKQSLDLAPGTSFHNGIHHACSRNTRTPFPPYSFLFTLMIPPKKTVYVRNSSHPLKSEQRALITPGF